MAAAQSRIQDGTAADNTSKDVCCNKESAQPVIMKAACCNPAQGTSASGSEPHPLEQGKECHCCDDKTEVQDDCCKPLEIASTGFPEDCCVGLAEKSQDSVKCGMKDIKVNNDCCAPNSTDYSCKKSSCSAPEPPQAEHLDKPSCCKDKAFPCCDVSCLDRLALSECENEKQAAQLEDASNSKLECSVTFSNHC